MSHLKYILADERPPNENPIGVLTTLNRDKWATVRTQLCNAGIVLMQKIIIIQLCFQNVCKFCAYLCLS